VVLDLRNNPGGYLTGSVYIASEFLRNGDVVIQEDGNGLKHNYAVNRKGKILDKPLVVIVNKGSASASEIVAGALQDRSRAKLVGEMSFGKGTIQDAQDLDDGAGLHVTVAKWLTPKGKWINGTGLAVDYKVEMDENNQTKDPQLEKAIELLN
jgi:carboxyl-terminal processing protease